jgi:hypothetical protein
MLKTSCNLEQRSFAVKQRTNKLLILTTITTYVKSLLQFGTKKFCNQEKTKQATNFRTMTTYAKSFLQLGTKSFIIEQRLNKLLEVLITITTNAKNLHLAPPWKQNTSGYNVTNNTQESHMLKFFAVPNLGNKMYVDTK